ncbi:hypothetical protein GCM10027614_67070 [Micromonospora vulcania]
MAPSRDTGTGRSGGTARAVTRTLSEDPLGGTVRRTVLPSGLRVLTEAIPTMRSVSFGIWVAVGSRDESGPQAGAAHFLEHLLFKGTNKRTALEISSRIEAVGGETNAFTTKEYTCYYARVLDEDLPLAIDVMCDLVADSLLEPADVETERGVILEEIAMHDDEPGDEVHDLFAQAVYGDHPLGRLISGTEETVTPMTRQQIEDFYRRHYTPPQIVIAAAGNLDHAAVVKLVRQAVRGTPLDSDPATPAPYREATPRYAPSRPPIWWSRRRPSRRTSSSAAPASIASTSGASPSGCSTTCSAAACPAGCSRRSASSGAWPTRSTPTPASTPTAACSRSTPAARRARSTRCWH